MSAGSGQGEARCWRRQPVPPPWRPHTTAGNIKQQSQGGARSCGAFPQHPLAGGPVSHGHSQLSAGSRRVTHALICPRKSLGTWRHSLSPGKHPAKSLGMVGSFAGKMLPNSESTGSRHDGSSSPTAELNATTCSAHG